MKKELMGVAVVIFFFSFGYAGNAYHDLILESTGRTEPGADAVKLYSYIMKPEPYYSSWNLLPGTRKLATGSAPHGSFITTYVNNTALSSLQEKGKIADGALVIMENYDGGKHLETLSVMYKIKDYNPDAGDWFWVEYGAKNGNVLASGIVDVCITCHKSKQEDEYLHKERK